MTIEGKIPNKCPACEYSGQLDQITVFKYRFTVNRIKLECIRCGYGFYRNVTINEELNECC